MDQYIPWDYTLTSTAGQCPSKARVLGTYAVTAAIISALCLLVGHRRIARWITCHWLGHPDSRAWRWTWIFPLGLSLAAAAINVAIIVQHESRDSDYPRHSLFFLQLTLPRMSFFCLLIVFCIQLLHRRHEQTRQIHEGQDENAVKKGLVSQVDHGSAAASALIAELLIQLPLLSYLGKIGYFAFSNGYLPTDSNYPQVPTAARMMHGAALYHLGSSCVALLVLIVYCTGLFPSFRPSQHRHIKYLMCVCVILGMFTFCADWIFWAGFLELAGDTYCVPELELQAGIRIVLSALGAFFGGAI
ncbi:Hypothetical protein NCS54_01228600 [Fusarium falciforme]|uniref:Hypothetical protein n=1 Tax=Fusarium falciforme TaxID=195108 RepID=UPI0023012866|nr:Hypothetical protein NCS54_01228600 [Fusarium falciforme]WAO94691.1 Hypothetical protein NCS54_01228600 [Fusarium falciforme]